MLRSSKGPGRKDFGTRATGSDKGAGKLPSSSLSEIGWSTFPCARWGRGPPCPQLSLPVLRTPAPSSPNMEGRDQVADAPSSGTSHLDVSSGARRIPQAVAQDWIQRQRHGRGRTLLMGAKTLQSRERVVGQVPFYFLHN